MIYTCLFCHQQVKEEDMLLFRNMPLKHKRRDIVADKACEVEWNKEIEKIAKETNTVIFNVNASLS